MNQSRRKTLHALDLDASRAKLDAGLDALRSAWPTDGDSPLAERMAAFVAAFEGLGEEEGQIDALESAVRQEADDEQESFDNLPEGLQQAERGQHMEEAAGFLQQAAEGLMEAGLGLHEAAEATKRLDALADKATRSEEEEDEAANLREEVICLVEACVRSIEEARDEVSEAIAC